RFSKNVRDVGGSLEKLDRKTLGAIIPPSSAMVSSGDGEQIRRGLRWLSELWRLRTMDPGLCLYQELPVPRHSDATKAAIKNAVDIVVLVSEYLPLRRAGSKFKALCPFHDDHNPSLEINPE